LEGKEPEGGKRRSGEQQGTQEEEVEPLQVKTKQPNSANRKQLGRSMYWVRWEERERGGRGRGEAGEGNSEKRRRGARGRREGGEREARGEREVRRETKTNTHQP
jgi:hypothetical protein